MKKFWLISVTVSMLCLHAPGQAQTGDSDRDAVLDDIDQCLSTASGVVVDATGCPAQEQSDGDHDGVPDAIDRCPSSPPNAGIDARGCAMDQDGDGVADGLDRCSGTAPGVTVDASGCASILRQPEAAVVSPTPPPTAQLKKPPLRSSPSPAPTLAPHVVAPPPSLPVGHSMPMRVSADEVPASMRPRLGSEEGTLLRMIAFSRGSQKLDATAQDGLTRIAETLVTKFSQRSQLQLRVIGHPDPDQASEPAENLATARANQVKSFLVQRGVPRDRILSEAVLTIENRRVELRMLGIDDRSAAAKAPVAASAPTPVLVPVPAPTPAAAAAHPSAPTPTPAAAVAPAAELAGEKLGWVLFKEGSIALDARAVHVLKAVLPQLRETLAADPSKLVEIQGGADVASEDRTAKQLSMERALQVRDWLVKQGIDAKRLHAVGLGNQYAVNPQFLLNRRADLWLVSR